MATLLVRGPELLINEDIGIFAVYPGEKQLWINRDNHLGFGFFTQINGMFCFVLDVDDMY